MMLQLGGQIEILVLTHQLSHQVLLSRKVAVKFGYVMAAYMARAYLVVQPPPQWLLEVMTVLMNKVTSRV